MVKTYRAISNLEFCTFISVKGKDVRIRFSGGNYSTGRMGVFSTDQPDIQQALESSPLFNKSYRLETILDDVKKTPKSIISDIKEENPEKPIISDTKEEGSELDKQKGEPMIFENFNAFRDYLVKEHNCEFANVRSLEKAEGVAKELDLHYQIGK